MNQTSVAVNRRPALKLALQYSQRRCRYLLLLALLAAVLSIGGCGNKGPLKLPDQSGLNGQAQ